MSAQRERGTKSMVLRLDQTLAERLQVVADAEGRSVSDVVREAIADLVERRGKDKAFLHLLEENLARQERVLRELRDGRK